jgi:hypothetical protein
MIVETSKRIDVTKTSSFEEAWEAIPNTRMESYS